MAAEAGCSSWRMEDDERERQEEEEEEEEEETELAEMEGVNFSNSSLMPPPPTPPLPPPPAIIPLPPPESEQTKPLPLPPSSEEVGTGEESQDSQDSAETEELGNGVPWHLTPEVVLVKVLACLDDVDRCNASVTCTAWRRVFRNPSLWRRRHFVFRGYEALERQDRYCQFLTQLGWHVRHATIELCRPNINTATVIAKAFETFVNRLNKCHGVRLLSITIISADFLSGWHFFSHNRGKVVRSLCNLLKKQSCLRSADLSYCLMDRDEGSRLLDSLSYGTRLHPKQYLSTLDLRQFFSPGTRAVSFTRYQKVMDQFVTLACVRMDLRSLNETILQTMSKASAKTLRRLEIDFYADESVGVHAIGSYCWREVAQRCQGLAVMVRIHGLCGFSKYASVLVRGMPLHELRLTYLGVEDLSNPELLRSIDGLILYLSGVYYQTLNKVQIQLRPEMEVSADTALVTLVRRCLHLADINVNFVVQAATFLRILETIQKNRTASEKGCKKTRLRLNIRGMTPELDQSIKRLTSTL
ncbi:F-box only protein 39-like [Littorina saxatilis]|uniref:F-box domain-containing protein n=1 Tax=Littorina saxatilis TaxID=31220 RepID=A0AAN9AII8_9CAEN